MERFESITIKAIGRYSLTRKLNATLKPTQKVISIVSYNGATEDCFDILLENTDWNTLPHQQPDAQQNDTYCQQNRTRPSRDETGHRKSQSQHDE